MALALDLLSFAVGGAAGLGAGFILLRQAAATRKEQAEKNILLEQHLQALLQENATLKAEQQAFETQIRRHKEDLAGMEEKFSLQFENLANRIFQEKSALFKKESQEGLGQMLAPLRERLQEFQKKVDDSFGQQAKEQFSLKREIENIIAVNQKMTVQTESLTKALTGDVKVQGSWGEVVLEKILDMSGLRKDIDYIVQGAELKLKHADGSGGHLKPDVIIMLPEDRHIIVDSKVSLTAYERFCAAATEAEKAASVKDFLASIKAHVQGLEQRRYQDTEKLGTPDFVLMFMPIEGAYALAMHEDSSLYGYAWEKRVAIVCPSTLFISLRTIASLWRIELQNRNALEIARQGGQLYDKVVGFVEDMQALGQKISQTQRVYDDAFKKLSSGTGNIVKRTEDLKALGLKTAKNMPKELAEAEEPPLKIAENG